jgi:hypothetical protein
MADLDQDGFMDIVSVHESDVEYDGVPDGHIRVAFGTADPDEWILTTLSSGEEAAAPEDVSIADLNGDGFLDIVAACELAHLIYFQNPGVDIRRTESWPRLIPPATNGRGSYIRVFFADLTGDGRPEVVTPNKGAQNPSRTQEPSAISFYEVVGDPLAGSSWVEHELIRVTWPINSEPVDIDGDGDLDILGGSVADTTARAGSSQHRPRPSGPDPPWRLPGQLDARHHGVAGHRKDDPRPADSLRQCGGRSAGRVHVHAVGASPEGAHLPPAVRLL